MADAPQCIAPSGRKPTAVATYANSERPRCKGKVKLRDEAGEPLKNPDGTYLTRPCKQLPIKGGTVCMKHGGAAPQVRAKANRRLLAMVEPALVRLADLVQQEAHLPTALGAIQVVLARAGANAIGPQAKDAGGDQRPIINIGIKVGGIDKPVVSVGMLPAAVNSTADDVEEGELVGDESPDQE